MSAFDPKRTLGDSVCCDAQQPSFHVVGCRPRAWKRLMRRRDFITLLGGAAVTWPLALRAQQSSIAKIGFLGAGTAAGYAKQFEAFQSGLHDRGYIEGKNIIVYSRWAQGEYDRLAALASELVALGVSVLVTHGTPGTSAAKKVTATIPIVMAVTGDADKTGLIEQLARPGGNITGETANKEAGPEKKLKPAQLYQGDGAPEQAANESNRLAAKRRR